MPSTSPPAQTANAASELTFSWISGVAMVESVEPRFTAM